MNKFKCIVGTIILFAIIITIIILDINRTINLDNQCKDLGYDRYEIGKNGFFNEQFTYCVKDNNYLQVINLGDKLVIK